MNPVKNFMEVVNRNSNTGAFLLDGVPFYIRCLIQRPDSFFVTDTPNDSNNTHFSKLFHIIVDWKGMEMDIRVVGKGKGHANPHSTIGFIPFTRDDMQSYDRFITLLERNLQISASHIK